MSTTYVARAPITGPSTAELPAVRDDPAAYRGGWPPQHHRPLIAAGVATLLITTPVVILYAFVASDPHTALPARALLLTACIILGVGGAGCFIAAAMVRAHDRAIIQATEYGVREVHGLDPEVRAVDTHLSAIVGRLEAAVGQRVEGLAERVEAVEQRPDRDDDVLRGIAGWAMQVDQRLARLQPCAHEGVTVSAQGNGHHDVTDESGDLPEGVRGYLLGFYDREKDDRG